MAKTQNNFASYERIGAKEDRKMSYNFTQSKANKLTKDYDLTESGQRKFIVRRGLALNNMNIVNIQRKIYDAGDLNRNRIKSV